MRAKIITLVTFFGVLGSVQTWAFNPSLQEFSYTLNAESSCQQVHELFKSELNIVTIALSYMCNPTIQTCDEKIENAKVDAKGQLMILNSLVEKCL